jgi:hypothetical protein
VATTLTTPPCQCACAAETCEELFTPRAPHIDLALAGVEVIANGSGSHHQLRKMDLRLDLIRGATAKVGRVLAGLPIKHHVHRRI